MIGVRACPPCEGTVPIVSPLLVEKRLARMPMEKRVRLIEPSLRWLTERHPGVVLYEGITGRQYSADEKQEIGFDQAVVVGTPCPYRDRGKCLMGGLGPQYTYALESDRGPWGFLPSLVMRLLDITTFREMARLHAIADAKIALMTRRDLFYHRGTATLEDKLAHRAPADPLPHYARDGFTALVAERQEELERQAVEDENSSLICI